MNRKNKRVVRPPHLTINELDAVGRVGEDHVQVHPPSHRVRIRGLHQNLVVGGDVDNLGVGASEDLDNGTIGPVELDFSFGRGPEEAKGVVWPPQIGNQRFELFPWPRGWFNYPMSTQILFYFSLLLQFQQFILNEQKKKKMYCTDAIPPYPNSKS